MSWRVLVVSEDPGRLGSLRDALQKSGVVVTAKLLPEARACLATSAPDALFCYVDLPNVDSLTLIRWVDENRPDMTIVALTQSGDVMRAVEAINAGAECHYIDSEIDEAVAALSRIAGRPPPPPSALPGPPLPQHALEWEVRFQLRNRRTPLARSIFRPIPFDPGPDCSVTPSHETLFKKNETSVPELALLLKRTNEPDGPDESFALNALDAYRDSDHALLLAQSILLSSRPLSPRLVGSTARALFAGGLDRPAEALLSSIEDPDARVLAADIAKHLKEDERAFQHLGVAQSARSRPSARRSEFAVGGTRSTPADRSPRRGRSCRSRTSVRNGQSSSKRRRSSVVRTRRSSFRCQSSAGDTWSFVGVPTDRLSRISEASMEPFVPAPVSRVAFARTHASFFRSRGPSRVS